LAWALTSTRSHTSRARDGNSRRAEVADGPRVSRCKAGSTFCPTHCTSVVRRFHRGDVRLGATKLKERLQVSIENGSFLHRHNPRWRPVSSGCTATKIRLMRGASLSVGSRSRRPHTSCFQWRSSLPRYESETTLQKAGSSLPLHRDSTFAACMLFRVNRARSIDNQQTGSVQVVSSSPSRDVDSRFGNASSHRRRHGC
jgi:hypothetical protein